MNGYERIMAAMRGERPGRVPVMLHNFLVAAKESNISMKQFRDDPKKIAEAFIHATEKYGLDGILVDIDTVTLAGSLGVPVDFPENEPARTHRGILESPGKVRDLKPPKVENYKYIQVWLEAVRKISDYFKDEVFLRGNCDQAPFSLASMLRGTENFMIDLMTVEPRDIMELLDYCLEATSGFIRLMAQTGAHMVSNGDSPAGPDMISPEFYEKYALPYEQKIVEEAHKAGMLYTLHICGNTEKILDKMVMTGADALELDYKTDTVKTFEALHDKTVFIGNIDPSGVLALGSPVLVTAKTTELLNIFTNTNRFILNAGCAIPAQTPEENLWALVNTARNFIPGS